MKEGLQICFGETWAHCLIIYNCFSDVLEFDTTYKTNIYGRPLAIFVGSNNHRATILFGSSLLVDETVETYTWLLKTFLHSMKGKKTSFDND